MIKSISWKRLIVLSLCAITLYYMAKFTFAHLKEDGMVWWGGWIAVGLFAAAAFIMAQQLRALHFQTALFNDIMVALRVLVLLVSLIFLWEALVRGIPLSTETWPAPSQLLSAPGGPSL